MFWRALVAFLVLPGVVALVIPLWLARSAAAAFSAVGLPPLCLGVIGLLWTVRDFYVAGKGTLAPWAPPRNLVSVGLYRFSRNPMYLSVLLILAGWALGFRLRTLWTYAGAVLVLFYFRVLLFEEPWLARTHGDAWQRYRGRVARWLFKV